MENGYLCTLALRLKDSGDGGGGGGGGGGAFLLGRVVEERFVDLTRVLPLIVRGGKHGRIFVLVFSIIILMRMERLSIQEPRKANRHSKRFPPEKLLHFTRHQISFRPPK